MKTRSSLLLLGILTTGIITMQEAMPHPYHSGTMYTSPTGDTREWK